RDGSGCRRAVRVGPVRARALGGQRDVARSSRERDCGRLIREDRGQALVAPPGEELEAEAVRVIRLLEARRESLVVEYPLALLVDVQAIPRAEAEPALREDAHAAEEVHRVVRERVRRAPARVDD